MANAFFKQRKYLDLFFTNLDKKLIGSFYKWNLEWFQLNMIFGRFQNLNFILIIFVLRKIKPFSMKKILISAVFGTLFLVSCSKTETPKQESNSMLKEPTEQEATVAKTPEEEGKDLIEKSSCLTCHKEDGKLIGPSYKEVAAKYTEADIDKLADKIIAGGSGVWGETAMTPHPGMDKENAKKMVKYILTLKK